MTRRDWHTRAALPMVFWMFAAICMVGAHRFVPRAMWLLVHFATLGILSNAVVVWSNHFTDAVLRSRDRGHRREVAELSLLNGGLLLLVAGVVGQWAAPVWLGATTLVAMAVVAIVGIGRQAAGSLPNRFAGTIRWYQAAAACLVAGVVLGALMAVPFGRWADALLPSHLALNALGWLGLTILGTLTSLWPTMLRAKAPEGVEAAARRALPVLLGGITLVALAPFMGVVSVPLWRLATTLGLLAYLTGVLLQARMMLLAWRAKRPTTFPLLSAAAGVCWLLAWLLWVAVRCLLATSPAAFVVGLRNTVPALVAGVLLQVLLGALAYLVPVVLGGGPAMVRATTDRFERGAVARLGVVNLGLALFVLPITSLWKVTTSSSVFLALALFWVLLVQAWWDRRRGRALEPREPRPHRLRRGLAWAMAWTVLGAGAAAAADPVSFRAQFGTSDSSNVVATGHTTTVKVVAKGMRFVPDHVTVPAGDRLVIQLSNQDSGMVHDLQLADGRSSGRLDYGKSTSFDVGVVGSSMQGWCSVAGHKQLGMVFAVNVTGTAPASASASSTSSSSSSSPTLPSPVSWPDSFQARSAVLPAVGSGTVHRITLRITDTIVEVAPGVKQTLWTFNGQAPGPVIHAHLGDTVEVTLVNDGDMGHSIDFHAGDVSPDQPMRTIAPGKSLVYRFTARRAGIWMYHCSTAPMSLHIANGMYGAVVVDPPNLPKVDHEYVVVQGELYFGANGANGVPGIADSTKIAERRPDAVVFNGLPNQYDKRPLTVKRGQRIRIWVLDAGVQDSLAFHVVGAQFDTVYREGAYDLTRGQGGSQTLGLLASQGGFVEFSPREAGTYSFVNHQMTDAEIGAHGKIVVK